MASEIVGLAAAAEFAGVSHPTILVWCDRHGIGEKRDGRWFINRSALRRVMKAKAIAAGRTL
jgi:hypothetical protein